MMVVVLFIYKDSILEAITPQSLSESTLHTAIDVLMFKTVNISKLCIVKLAGMFELIDC